MSLQSATVDAETSASTSASPATPRIALAVLGDSDSQGYQNVEGPSASTVPRGGAYHASTFQWTEALARLRGDEFDLGAWGVHGMRGRAAIALEWLGLAHTAESSGWEVRAPVKQDHRYNFAFAGDGCADLFGGWSRQAPRLVRTMDAEPSRWRNGIVVIRIGGNDFGNDPTNLGLLAQDADSPAVRAKMDYCIGEIKKATAAIHSHHPETRIVLVGAFNNSHWERYFDRWQSPPLLANIARGLDYFDDALRAMTQADPRMAFFDDGKWFDSIWGRRGPDGRPDYRVLALGATIRVSNTGGDAPSHATLADGHAGLVWNAKWAQALVALIETSFGLRVAPIADDELQGFLLATGAFTSLK